MVDGVCTMCGYTDAHHAVAAVENLEATDSLDGELFLPVASAWDSEDDDNNLVSVAPQHAIAPVLNTAMFDCPACANRISETAINCPKCGFVVTGDVVAAQDQKRAEAERIANLAQAAGAVVGLTVFGFLWALMSNGSKSSSYTTVDNHTPAEKAVYPDRDDFNVGASAQMQASLARLSKRYHMSEELVASKLLVAQDLLANQHVRKTLQQIADSVEAANPTTLPQSFDELLASIVTLSGERTDLSADWPNFQKSELAEPKKRKIFYDLVAAQDAGVGDERAYIIIAERFNISIAEVQEIGIEGAVRDWPMP